MKRALQFLIMLLMALVLGQTSAQQEVPDPADSITQYLEHSKFNKYQKLVLGDPVATLRDYADIPRKANLPGYVLGLAGVLIVVGFAISLWRAAVIASETAIKGAFMNMIVSALMLGMCFNFANGTKVPWSFSAIMFNQWGATYDWSRRTFAKDMDVRIEEAQAGMYALMGQVVSSASLVAIPGGTGVAIRSARGMALAAKGEKISAGLAAAGTASKLETASLRSGAQVLGKMNVAMSFLNYILMAYSFVVTVSGLLVLASIYVLPLGFAAINFGSTRILWTVFGTFFASWFTILLLPLFLAVSLNKSFVEPAKTMEYYTQNLSIQRVKAQDEATRASWDVQQDALDSVEDCQAATPAGDLQADPCAEVQGGGWVERLLTGMSDVLTQRLGVISDLFNGIVNTIQSAFWGLSVSIVGMMVSIGIMLATPGRFASFFGGVAEQMKGK